MTVKEPRRSRPSPPEQPRRARVHRPLGADPSPWDVFLARVFGRPIRYQPRGKEGLPGPQWVHFVIDRFEDLQRGWGWLKQTSLGRRVFSLVGGRVGSVRNRFRSLGRRLGFRDPQTPAITDSQHLEYEANDTSQQETPGSKPRRSYFDAEPLIPRAASLWPGQRSAFKGRGPKEVVPPASEASPALHRQLGALSREASTSRGGSSADLGAMHEEQITDKLEGYEPDGQYSSSAVAIQSPAGSEAYRTRDSEFEQAGSEVETQHVHIQGDQITDMSGSNTPTIRTGRNRPLSALASLVAKETETERGVQTHDIETESTLVELVRLGSLGQKVQRCRTKRTEW